MKKNKTNPGSLGGEMRMRVKEHCRTLSNHTKSNYMHACRVFDAWRKEAGLSNRYVRENPIESVVQWAAHMEKSGVAKSTIHTMVSGCCCGLGIPSNGIAKHGSAMDKSKSLGRSARAQAALEKESNTDIIRFQSMVGGRRAALGRLTGKDFGYCWVGLCNRLSQVIGLMTAILHIDVGCDHNNLRQPVTYQDRFMSLGKS